MAYLAIESQHLIIQSSLMARTQCRPEIYRVIYRNHNRRALVFLLLANALKPAIDV